MIKSIILCICLLLLYTTMGIGGSEVPATVTGLSGASNTAHIDFSILDTLAGVILAVVIMLVVGLILIKYGLIRLGSGTTVAGDNEAGGVLKDRELRRADRLEVRAEFAESLTAVKELIMELREDIKTYLREQQECQRRLPEKYVQWETLNRIMDELKEDRFRRWDKFDMHVHDEHSGVVVLRK
jgi:hypothetical protein